MFWRAIYPATPTHAHTWNGRQDQFKGSLVQAAPGAMPVQPGVVLRPTETTHLSGRSYGGPVTEKLHPEPDINQKGDLLLQNVYLREESAEQSVTFEGLERKSAPQEQPADTSSKVIPPWRRKKASTASASWRRRHKPKQHRYRQHRRKQAVVSTTAASRRKRWYEYASGEC